jgi:ketosteroid isomerase-like protein
MNDVSPCVERFKALFNAMTSGDVEDLADVYADNVTFTDPFVSVSGLKPLTRYFGEAYTNVISCHFNFETAVVHGGDVCLPWVMHLRHRRIRRGQPIAVDGVSRLRIVNDRIVMHRDYFDAGQLLYENLPILGAAVRWIRKHAA